MDPAVNSRLPIHLGRIVPTRHSETEVRFEAETATRIKSASRRLFHERGFLATTVREIAIESGLTPGAIYKHFDSKHQILHAIIMETHRQLNEVLLDAIAGAGRDPRDQLRALVEAFVLYNTASPEEARVANREYRQLPVEWAEQVVLMRRHVRSTFTNVIRRGEQLGVMTMPTGAGPRAHEVLAMAVVNMAILAAEWFRPAGPLDSATIATTHSEMAIRMVGAELPAVV